MGERGGFPERDRLVPTKQVLKSGRCLNIPSKIVPTALILQTLLIMCETTALLPVIGLNMVINHRSCFQYWDIQYGEVNNVGEWLMGSGGLG